MIYYIGNGKEWLDESRSYPQAVKMLKQYGKGHQLDVVRLQETGGKIVATIKYEDLVKE